MWCGWMCQDHIHPHHIAYSSRRRTPLAPQNWEFWEPRRLLLFTQRVGRALMEPFCSRSCLGPGVGVGGLVTASSAPFLLFLLVLEGSGGS